MKVIISNQVDFISGLLFLTIGVTAVLLSRAYPMGTPVQMGSAYFPTILGGILILLGLIIGTRGFRMKGERLKPWKLRPLFLILGAVAVFGLSIHKLGLIISTILLLVIARLGGQEFMWKEVIILTVCLIFLTVLIFVYGLSLPLKLGWF